MMLNQAISILCVLVFVYAITNEVTYPTRCHHLIGPYKATCRPYQLYDWGSRCGQCSICMNNYSIEQQGCLGVTNGLPNQNSWPSNMTAPCAKNINGELVFC
eukprot:TRINITY_DN6125_c0_g1_i1.p1 TRINITY_DN6125_c0_g1~~TRINITY_DN6125_c0_g1_i1.p1  ORF type:complete len:102 (+),score=7.78 TRINITY_DN6125_c0_g1_i1:29-334(+)